MTDIWSKSKRSDVMSRIKGSGNRGTELKLIGIFKECRITGWRRRQTLIGKPDFVFPKLRLTVFVDGCFWHGCPKHGTSPKSNTEFWQNKIGRNVERDQEVNRELRSRGWRVFRIWEHELTLKNRSRMSYRLRRIGLLE
jgi:DNA mismatch endonuclease, patch repair protein